MRSAKEVVEEDNDLEDKDRVTVVPMATLSRNSNAPTEVGTCMWVEPRRVFFTCSVLSMYPLR